MFQSTEYRMRKIALIIIFFFFLFPSFTTVQNTYQTGLWTSSTLTRSSQTNDIIYRLGGNIGRIVEWKRINLGFPLKSITIDYQPMEKIYQIRFEADSLLLTTFLIILVLLIIFGGIKIIKKKGLSNE